jgi:predicted glutamine amidotransferase
VGTSDGERLWAFRYSSSRESRSLFYSTDLETLRRTYPDNPNLQKLSEETRLVVSEPVGDLTGAWNEVPESSYGVIQKGDDELHPFRPEAP